MGGVSETADGGSRRRQAAVGNLTWRKRMRDGFLPSALQNSSTSTPAGRFGSSFDSGRSCRSVASITRTRSTPAGRDLPSVASHLSPVSLPRTLSSSTGPFPGLGNVATLSPCPRRRGRTGGVDREKGGDISFPLGTLLSSDQSSRSAK